MRTTTTLDFGGTDWRENLELAIEAERLGLDDCWVAEAWGGDAAAPLGYLAARTSRMRLGSGIFPLGSRSPALLAMTALTLARMSEGRFVLGLGVSGPQVVEGLHGVPFARPLARLRETVAVIRAACAGERVEHHGATVDVPWPGGEGRPMRLSSPPDTTIPLYLAALSPRTLELTGELADGWLGTSFVPEGAAASFAALRTGARRAGRDLATLDVCQGAEVAFAADAAEQSRLADARRRELAFSLGGMGSAATNFYRDAYARQGWADVAFEVHRRWQAGDRDGATALVTEDMVLATTLIGTEERVRERLVTWRDAGVTTVRLYPAGATLTARIETLARAIELVRSMG